MLLRNIFTERYKQPKKNQENTGKFLCLFFMVSLEKCLALILFALLVCMIKLCTTHVIFYPPKGNIFFCGRKHKYKKKEEINIIQRWEKDEKRMEPNNDLESWGENKWKKNLKTKSMFMRCEFAIHFEYILFFFYSKKYMNP